MKNKLISMVDYVIEFHGITDPIHYAKFLSQPLEKWMFVPCDEDGNVLEKPKKYLFDEDPKLCDLVKQYQKAKDRVLFEGLDIDVAEHHIKMGRNIEYLANFGTLTLTASALKQIS